MEQDNIKSYLHELIDKTDDQSILESLTVLLENRIDKEDFWDYLPEFQKESINRGLAQAEKGHTKTHDEVMKKYTKWLSR